MGNLFGSQGPAGGGAQNHLIKFFSCLKTFNAIIHLRRALRCIVGFRPDILTYLESLRRHGFLSSRRVENGRLLLNLVRWAPPIWF